MLKYAFLSMDGVSIKPNINFTGSAIRGCFGYALREAVCPFPLSGCDKCIRSKKCLFYKIYQNTDSQPKVRFETIKNSYDFRFFMFEDMPKHIPSFILAFKNMQHIGFGYKKDKFEFDKIFLNGKLIYKDKVLLTKEFRSLNFNPKFEENSVKIVLKSPLRIKQNGKLVKENLDISNFLKGINSHYNHLKGLDKKVDYEPKFSEVKQNLKFIECERFSNRQGKKHEFGGVMGDIKIYGLDKSGIKLLELSEIIGAGKSTAFGLGSVRLEYI